MTPTIQQLLIVLLVVAGIDPMSWQSFQKIHFFGLAVNIIWYWADVGWVHLTQECLSQKI